MDFFFLILFFPPEIQLEGEKKKKKPSGCSDISPHRPFHHTQTHKQKSLKTPDRIQRRQVLMMKLKAKGMSDFPVLPSPASGHQ